MNLKKIMAAILSATIIGTTVSMTKRDFYNTSLTVNAAEETGETFDSWQEAYRDTLLDFMYGGAYCSKSEYGDMCSTYAIHDMNGDGTPELFINYQPMADSESVLYTFYDSKVIELATLPRAGFVSYCGSDGLIETSGGGGAGGWGYTNYSIVYTKKS